MNRSKVNVTSPALWAALVAAATLFIGPIRLCGQDVAAKCSSQKYRQLDFWLGTWEVRNPKGGFEGHNTVSKEHGGCVLIEHWSSPDQTGISLNFYDSRTHSWKQHWIDSFGNSLDLSGGLIDGRMTLTGDRLTPTGEFAKERNVWFVDSEKRLRNVWDYSLDGGKTWTIRFDGVYTPTSGVSATAADEGTTPNQNGPDSQSDAQTSQSTGADDSDAHPQVTEKDVRIVRQAQLLISRPSKWNRHDTRQCPVDEEAFSLYCAIERASQLVSGDFEHREAAMQEARFVVDRLSANRNYEHRLMDYNNDPRTTFADVQTVLRLTKSALVRRIAEQIQDRPLFAVMNKSAEDWNAGDLDAFLTCYKNSPDILFVGPHIRTGYSGLAKGYREAYPTRARMGTLSFSELKVQWLDRKFATMTGKFHLVRAKTDGGNQDGYYLLVFEHTSTGWKIIRDDSTTVAKDPHNSQAS